MANKIKVKMMIVLDDIEKAFVEEERIFDTDISGTDLSEAIIDVAAQVTADAVKEAVK